MLGAYPKEVLELVQGTRAYTQTELNDEFKIVDFIKPFYFTMNKSTGEEALFLYQEVPRLYWKYTGGNYHAK